MSKILIINQGNINSNLGDLAIRVNLKNLFDDLSIDTDFAYLTAPNSKMTQFPSGNYFPSIKKKSEKEAIALKRTLFKLFNFFYWGMKNYNPIKKVLKNGGYSAIIIGGGQLINASHQEYPHSFSIAIYWWTKIAKMFSPQSPVILFGCGVDNGFNFWEKILYKRSLIKINEIFLRDKFSISQMDKIFKRKSELMPDVAFYHTEESLIKTRDRENKLLYNIYSFDEFNVNYNYNNITKEDYYHSNFLKAQELIKTYGCKIQLFSSTTTDYIESMNFKDYLEKHGMYVEIVKSSSLEDLNNCLRDSKYVYSGRMHALILAFKVGCICLPFLLSRKLTSFQDDYLLQYDPMQLRLLVEKAGEKVINLIK